MKTTMKLLCKTGARVRPALSALVICTLVSIAGTKTVFAHGVAGKRFFPTTLTVEDPFVNDELTLPTVTSLRENGVGDEPSTRETEFSAEYTKTLTPNLGLSLEGEYRIRNPREGGTRSGFGNLELGLKYQFLKSARHETILSLGLNAEVGDSGDNDVEADPFSTLTPGLFFGKGFGDLPEWAAYLRPFAVTAVVAGAFPLDASTRFDDEIERNPHVLETGFTLQYSIPYLQAFVKDVGLRAPFNRLIPVVEGAFATPLDRGSGGETSGTITPGIIWIGKKFQLGLGALIPINNRSGDDVGIVAQLHFFVDDIAPRSFGKPLFTSPLPSFGD